MQILIPKPYKGTCIKFSENKLAGVCEHCQTEPQNGSGSGTSRYQYDAILQGNL